MVVVSTGKLVDEHASITLVGWTVAVVDILTLGQVEDRRKAPP
jgi:hypothetical protein